MYPQLRPEQQQSVAQTITQFVESTLPSEALTA
jgi:hypothetical protein